MHVPWNHKYHKFIAATQANFLLTSGSVPPTSVSSKSKSVNSKEVT